MYFCTILLIQALSANANAGNIFAQVFENEMKIEAGEATFWVTIEYTDNKLGQKKRKDEIGQGVFVHCIWKTENKFFIELYDKSHAIKRRLICDGKIFDSGDGMLWDANVLTEWIVEPDWSYSRQFEETIWPFIIFVEHIYPLSHWIELNYTTFSSIFNIKNLETKDCFNSNGVICYKVRLINQPIILQNGCMEYRFSENIIPYVLNIASYGNKKIMQEKVYSEHMYIQQKWVASRCVRRDEMPCHSVLTSTIVDNNITFKPMDDKKFQIKDKNQLVINIEEKKESAGFFNTCLDSILSLIGW